MGVPSPLVTPEWLHEHRDDSSLRVLDATVWLTLDPAGGPPDIESGRASWGEAHIPGAGFADLIGDLSDADSPLPFMLPRPESLAAAMSRLGVGPGTHVVAYDAETGMWAARLWWTLRAFGFDAVSVLDGGLQAWRAQGLPLTSEPPEHPAAPFEASLRPDLVADRDEVEAIMEEGAACLVNALDPALFRGDAAIVARRPGRIPGSVNVPSRGLLDPATNRFRPPDELRELFASTGALDKRRIVTYCGGGIAASLDAFALAVLGRDDVAVYDGSLLDWVSDPAAPLETG